MNRSDAIMDDARTRRLAERISKIVASMLERRVKDPRLGFVTVTETRLTNDLREATVFYTVLGSPEEREETAVALKSATGIIRSEVGRIMGLRHTPSLEFVADSIPEDAQHIEELVNAAKARDEELAKAREGAEWAGDPDPYRKPAEDEDDFDDDDEDDEDGAVLAEDDGDDLDAAVHPVDGE
jgi:ribosome-binding factor A